MQLMTWTMARLGSRFGLVFEPYRKCVRHSALGRFLDQPTDLMVGLVEPGGVERVLPFTTEGTPLFNCEQFPRFNSITYRGYSETHRLRFEFNVHSVFYPQNEPLCIMPAFYLEMRVNPIDKVRWVRPAGDRPEQVELFIRIRRPDTAVSTAEPGGPAAIRLSYDNPLAPRHDMMDSATVGRGQTDRRVRVEERIVSLNDEAVALDTRDGLKCTIPVTDEGSGVKWRLVWAAHTREPVLQLKLDESEPQDAPFRYTAHWQDVDAVVEDAVKARDDNLALSRRFEKLLEQAPIRGVKRHLLNHTFQAYLANTFWCDVPGGDGRPRDWFSVWEGSCFYHSTIDVEYNNVLFYLNVWPQLLVKQFDQWARHANDHAPSGGAFLSHDMGGGVFAVGQAYPHPMEVEENCNYLLLMQTYMHWTGDTGPAVRHAPLLKRLVDYLIWTDRDHSGFPSEGVANTIDDASPAVQFSRKQTYLAVKRAAALRAAASLLQRSPDHLDLAKAAEHAAEDAARKIEDAAWLGDHYAVCVDKSAVGMTDVWTGKPLPYAELPGWDAYSIYTGNGELLPAIIGQPPLLDPERIKTDLTNAYRENLSRYGCGHTSSEPENVWVSQNLWRDHLARYLGLSTPPAAAYWDLQLMSNTHDQSLGFIDTYINNNLCFYPRGITAMGFFLSGPRLMIDRLAPGGAYITIEPHRAFPQRWPLLPLADWKAGKIPVCVVDEDGRAFIEGRIDPVIIHGSPADPAEPDDGLIG